MGKVVARLRWETAHEAIFIDPYFDPDKPKYRRSFEHFFQELLHNRKGLAHTAVG